MLGLTLDVGEDLVIKDKDGTETRIQFRGRSGRRARLSIDAPDDKQVRREKPREATRK